MIGSLEIGGWESSGHGRAEPGSGKLKERYKKSCLPAVMSRSYSANCLTESLYCQESLILFFFENNSTHLVAQLRDMKFENCSLSTT